MKNLLVKDALGPQRHVWAVVEAADHLAFRALLELIWGQVQTRLHERMIEHGVLFAARNAGKARRIGEHGPGAILFVESRASRVPVGTGAP